MKKKILLVLVLMLTLFGGLAFSDSGQAATTAVDDQAQLLSADEISQLNSQAQAVNDKIKGSLFIVTTSTNTEKAQTFAQNYLRDKIGNDANGVVLLIDMNQRKLYIATSGNMIDYLTDSRIDALLDEVTENVQNEAYYAAGATFIEHTLADVKKGVPSGSYRVDTQTGKITYYKSITPVEAGVAALVAVIVSLTFFFVIKARYQLKLGTYHYEAADHSNLNITEQADTLTNSFVTTRIIPKANNNNGGGGGGGSSTYSSGGGTFGGGGRDF